jgi:ammonia channel protein AmtB
VGGVQVRGGGKGGQVLVWEVVTHSSVCHVNTHHRSVQAANTLLNTHLSASLSGLCWVFLTYREDSCFHVTDVMNGAFAGLAGITPGSGFVNSQVHARSEQMIVRTRACGT